MEINKLIIWVFVLFVFSLNFVNAAEIFVSPSSLNVEEGENFTIEIWGDAPDDGTDIYGISFDIEYDEDNLELNSIEEGDFLANGSDDTFFGYDSSNGLISVYNIRDKTYDDSDIGIYGQGVFTIINFTATESGSVDIEIENVIWMNSTVSNSEPTIIDDVDIEDGEITIGDSGALTVSFISPTPADNSFTNIHDLTINASSENELDSCNLLFDGDSYTMNVVDDYCYVELVNLADGKHNFSVTGEDIDGNVDSTGKRRVTVDTDKPSLSNINTHIVSEESVVISWSTDELANSLVYYWNSTIRNVREETFELGHEIRLTELDNRTVYNFNVTSCDRANNCENSEGYEFLISGDISDDDGNAKKIFLYGLAIVFAIGAGIIGYILFGKIKEKKEAQEKNNIEQNTT